MKKATLLLFLLTFITTQAQHRYNLIVFTEADSAFTLFLNNIQQHESPEKNVWIGDLNAPMYKAKIVFADSSIETLKKTIYFPPEDSEVTYRIFEKKGALKMRTFSVVDLPIRYIERPNQKAVFVVTEPIYTETITTTQTIINSNDHVNMGVNIGGGGINVNIDTNAHQVGIYEETTTITTTNTVNTVDHYIMQGYNGPIGCPWPMEEADFQEARQTIASKDWDETRLSLAKQVISANCMFADQVRDIIELMEWEDTKLAFAKFAYSYTYDPGNYFKVSQAFEWESSTEELNRYISRY